MAIGFAFGGGGWLTLWYLGVLSGLIDSGALVPGVTPVGGTSAGAHAAAVACGAGNMTAVKEAALRAAAECEGEPGDAARRIPCRWRMDGVARAALRESVPRGSHARCSELLTLGLTRAKAQLGAAPDSVRVQIARPARSALAVRKFESDDDLIDAVSASGYLPCISGPGPFARYKVPDTIAGGYSWRHNYVCPRGASRCITIHSGPRGWLFAPESGHRRRRRELRAAAGGGGGNSGGSGSSGSGGDASLMGVAAQPQPGDGSTDSRGSSGGRGSGGGHDISGGATAAAAAAAAAAATAAAPRLGRRAAPAAACRLAGSLVSNGVGGGGNATGCEILNEVPTPVVYFPWDMDKIKIHIYPGKYNRVAMPWSQWQALVLHPRVDNLTYAYDLGVADGKAWAAENQRLWNRTLRG